MGEVLGIHDQAEGPQSLRIRAGELGPPNTMKTLECPDCGAPMTFRPTSKYGPFYGCSMWPACRATHGAHPNGEPLGTPATTAVKQARIRAHAAFDPLWKDAAHLYAESDLSPGKIRRITRGRAYLWLGDNMGLTSDECHVGMFDAAQCERVVELCQGMTPEAIREHGRARKEQCKDTE